MATVQHIVVIAALICICFITWRDLTSSTTTDKPSKYIPTPKLSKFYGPTLKFLFCYSCGYRKVYEQFAYALQQKHPSLNILGENYPPPTIRTYAAQILTILKFTLIVLVALGIDPFAYLNSPTPNIITWAIQNRIYACMMLFFVSNAIESQLVSTGAFEVTFNAVPVWSKLETGRVPSPQEIFQIIDNHMRLSPALYKT